MTLTVRQIAKREYDTIPAHIDDGIAWHWWKRAYDSASIHLQNTNLEKMQEYRGWLAQTANQLHYDSSSSYDEQYIAGFEKALNKFKEMFPVELVDAQTLSDHLDKIPGMDGEHRVITIGDLTEDETDNIYPKTQPHSFPPRD